jgi:peptidoglycan/LPS O-acetylase OafA/YrhL
MYAQKKIFEKFTFGIFILQSVVIVVLVYTLSYLFWRYVDNPSHKISIKIYEYLFIQSSSEKSAEEREPILNQQSFFELSTRDKDWLD